MEQIQREDAQMTNEDFQDRQQQRQSQEPPSVLPRGATNLLRYRHPVIKEKTKCRCMKT